MKKGRKVLAVGFIVAMLLTTVACGKKDTTVNGVSFEELRNWVYKREAVSALNNVDYDDMTIGSDRIFVCKFDMQYDSEDGEIAYPEPKTYTDELEDEAVEENEEDMSASEDVDAEAKKRIAVDAGITAEEESTDELADESQIDDKYGIAEDDLTMLPEGEVPVEYIEPSGTMTFKVDAYSFDGQKLMSYEQTYNINNSVYNYHTDDQGNFFYLRDNYYSDSLTGEYKEQYSLVAVGADGKQMWETEINPDSTDGYFYVSNILIDDQNIYVMSDSLIITMDRSGKIVNTTKFDGNNGLQNIIKCRNGEYLGIEYGETSLQVRKIDLKAGKLGEVVAMPFSLDRFNISSSKEHDFILVDSTGISYYDFGAQEPVKLMDLIASDIVDQFNSVSMINDNEFYSVFYDYESDKQNLYKFVKVDPKDVVEKETMTMAGIWIDRGIRKAVVDYNMGDHPYRISIKDYSMDNYNVEYQEMVNSFNNDIVTGKVPDIIVINGSLNPKKYAAKGILVDLNTMMEKDSTFNKDEYLTNVFDAASSEDGKLFTLIPKFTVTSLMGKKSIVGDKESWTVDEFMALADKYKDKKYFMGMMSKEDFLNLLLIYNESEFVDWTNGKVSFDSPEFVKLLKYTDYLPETIDYESEEANEFWNSYETLYREDKSILYTIGLYDYRDYSRVVQGNFGEATTLVGFPTNSGCGGSISFDYAYSISSKSKNKDAAWDFIKTSLSDDNQEMDGYGFPVKKSALDKMAQKAKERPYYMENGEKFEYDDFMYINGQEIMIKPSSDAEINTLNSYISSVNRITTNDNALNEIVIEEAKGYFAGQKSAEDVAKAIQGRTQIFVNESR